MYKLLLTFYLLVILISSYGQIHSTLDSLKKNINIASKPSEKLTALFAFCNEWESYNPDTLNKYATVAKKIAVSLKNIHSETVADYFQSIYLFQINSLDTALIKTTNILNAYKKQFPYDDMLVKIFALRGNILLRTSRMDELMTQDFEWIKLSEENKDTLGIARANIGLGNVDLKIKKYEEALLYYKKALELMQNPLFKRKLSFIFNNIAIIYYHLGKSDSSLFYVKQGIEYSKQDENNTNLANAFFLYGGMLAEFHKLKDAEESFKQAVEIRKKVGDVYYLVTDMAQFALFYADNNNPLKGIAICKEALALGNTNSLDYNSLNSIYESLAKNYLVSQDYKNYSEILLKQISLKDSLYKKSSAKALAEIQIKYDLQKKENTIVKQKLDITQRNNLLYGSIAFFIFMVTLISILFIGYRKRQALKAELSLKEEKRLSEIAIKDAGERERKRIAADLHDNMGSYATAIIANVNDIQLKKEIISEASFQNLKTNAGELMSNLRDTIWASNTENFYLTTISDRFKIYVQKIMQAYPKITVEISESISNDILFSPVKALNIFRILQEALTNALKHSQASIIHVTFKHDTKLEISVIDNGIGFKNYQTIDKGNGIKNMTSRAQDSELIFSIKRNEPFGTALYLFSNNTTN